VVEAWTSDYFSHQGPNYTIPPKELPHHPFYASEEPYVVEDEVTKLTLVPKPYQKPHPPIWLMVSSEPTARLAAERGYYAMAAGTPTDVLRDFVDVYAEVRSESGNGQFVRGEGWAVSRPVHVAPSMEEARRNFEIPVIRQREFQLYNRASQANKPKPEITWENLLKSAMLAGPPELVIEQTRIAKSVRHRECDYIHGCRRGAPRKDNAVPGVVRHLSHAGIFLSGRPASS